MALTIGQILQKEREKRDLSIADVAHETHIHADTIRGLEADDYSVFSSTTYAKSFLQLYSRHLEVDAGEALHDFDSVTENLNSGKFSYLESVTDAIEPGETIHPHVDNSHAVSYGDDNHPPRPLFLTIVVFLLVLVIPVFYFIGKRANSMEEATSIFKEALFSKGESLLNNQNPQKTNGIKSPTESQPDVPPDQADASPSLKEENTSQHRFPRPLTKSKPTPLRSNANLGAPIIANPVRPKGQPLKKTNTVQNRN